MQQHIDIHTITTNSQMYKF